MAGGTGRPGSQDSFGERSAPRDRGHRAPYAAGYRPPGVLLIAAELVDPRRDVSAAWEHWSRPDAGQGRPASFFALRELVGRSRQVASPVSVPHMALSFSIMLERLEGSAAVMASWRERIKRRYSP